MNKTDDFLPDWLIAFIVASFCFCSLALTYLLRFNFDIPASESAPFIYVFPFVIICRCLSFYVTGIYKRARHNNEVGWKTKLAIIQLIVSLFFVIANIILHVSPLKHYLMPYSIIIIEYLISTFFFVMLMNRDAGFSIQRNFGLDVVRACAIISVVLIHGGTYIVGHAKLIYLYSFIQIDGVTMFFVLSGFLIGNILLKTINETNFTFKNLFDFWIRRWFRTLPNYYLVLLFLIFIHHKMEIKPPDNLVNYFFFLQNFNHPCTFEFYGVSWSLCVEEWFYLIVPVLLFITMHVAKQISKQGKILFFIIFGIVTIALYRVYIIETLPSSNADLGGYVGVQVITRLDSILYGVLGAFLYYYKIPVWGKLNNIFLILGIAFILLFTYAHIPLIIYNTFKPLGFLLVLPKLSRMQVSAWRGRKVITFISIISYSMYLLHTTVVMELIMVPLCKLLNLDDVNTYKVILVKSAMYWVLTIMISSFVYICFERPMTSLRGKVAL